MAPQLHAHAYWTLGAADHPDHDGLGLVAIHAVEDAGSVLEFSAGVVVQRGGGDLQGAAAGIDDEEHAAATLFPGCLGIAVLVDSADPAHVVVYETWESIERDQAYRQWRRTPEGFLGDNHQFLMLSEARLLQPSG